MISADDVKQPGIKELVAVSCNFSKEHPTDKTR